MTIPADGYKGSFLELMPNFLKIAIARPLSETYFLPRTTSEIGS